MKKLTGSILLALVLFLHVGITIATEESYTFSSSDYDNAASLRMIDNSVAPKSVVFTSTSSKQGVSSMTQFGLFSIEE